MEQIVEQILGAALAMLLCSFLFGRCYEYLQLISCF